MIWAMQKSSARVWFPVDMHSDPKWFDFDNYMFKIDNTIYFQNSEQFRQALFWEKLKA